MLSGLLLAVGVWLAGIGGAHAQFTQHRDTIKIDPSGFPADIQRGYRLFSMKCNECHGLDTSLKPSMSATQWAAEVKRMQAMPSSQFNDAQARAILDFLNYDEAHRKSLNKSADQTGPAGGGGAGRQFYDSQGCATCHAIGGKGGASGPSLSEVGKRLSKEELTAVIQDLKAGKSSMPPLPPATTDQQVKDLVDYLASLGGDSQKPTAAAPPAENPAQPKASGTPPDPKSKPVPPAVASGPGPSGGGHQFYDQHGCATCHAIGGKGGTSGPALSDVGKRLSNAQLTEIVQKMKTGKSSMPPLPPGTTDQQAKHLVDFLATLTGQPQKENTGKPKSPDVAPVQTSVQSDPPSRREIVNMIDAETSQGTTALPGILLLFLVVATAALIGVIVFRPGVTATPAGKIIAFFGLFLLPLICAGMGTTYHIDRSKSTKFCLSCHEMEPFGKSLFVNDPNHLAAAHFQNHRVPAEEACYTCHSNYAMFGGLRAKIGGLRHVYVHYLGTPQAPEAIRLYEPFNNRECLHCHLGARSFEEGATHNAKPYLLAALKANAVSCVSSGCHQTVHNVASLNNAKFWKENRDPQGRSHGTTAANRGLSSYLGPFH